MKKLAFLLIALISLYACKKTYVTAPPSANLLVANVVAGGGTLNFNNLTTPTIGDNASATFPVLAGQSAVNLVNTTVTPVVTYYAQPLQASNAGNYSLFLGGTPGAVDAVSITETYHNFAGTDSLCGVRFMNLSTGSDPISVNVTGQNTGSTVSSLTYKAYSNFIQFPAKSADASYSFDFRDAGTGNLITSYTLYTPYFHNVTLVLSAAGVTLVQHP